MSSHCLLHAPKEPDDVAKLIRTILTNPPTRNCGTCQLWNTALEKCKKEKELLKGGEDNGTA